MAQQAVGVIGAGRMGLGMVESLRRHQHTVYVYDIDPARQQLAQALGAYIVHSAPQLVAHCQQVFLVVVNAAQIHSLLEGDDGLLAALKQKSAGTQVFINSTIAPNDTQAIAAAIHTTGAQLIDAPISGGPAKAHAGTMSMMLAAPQAALDTAMPLLRQLSGVQFVVSEQVGDAAKAKLVNNMLAAVNLVAAAEAFCMAQALDLDQDTLLRLVSASSGQSWICDERITRALSGDMAARAQMHVLTKDVTLANQAASGAGVKLRLGELARQVMQEGCDAGFNEQDDAAILHHLRKHYMLG
jgi:L-threonate 2-dehydrogenase